LIKKKSENGNVSFLKIFILHFPLIISPLKTLICQYIFIISIPTEGSSEIYFHLVSKLLSFFLLICILDYWNVNYISVVSVTYI